MNGDVNIVVVVDDNQRFKPTGLVECSQCGQKLFSIEKFEGYAVVRSKCRRCGKYNIIRIKT